MSEEPKLRVLVVDDEKLVRWSLKEHLGRRGYDVTAADSGEVAIQKLDQHPPDIMLLDVRLPGIDGVAVLERALAADADLAVIMMSAHSTVNIAVDAMKLGALDFLVKPFQFKDLDACLDRTLAQRQTRAQIARMAARRPGTDSALSSIIGASPEMEQIRALVGRLAASDATTVLIEGESGAGKEVVARAIHAQSARASKPFCQLNCGAVPDQLLESELFGHERGAFTDAHAQKRGLFEIADGGTVLLDEFGELPAAGQVKLLQLLESKTFRRVGGTQELRADVRIIAATNVDLDESVAQGRFRADLYYRLNVVSIQVPPLRGHPTDLPLLAAHFIARFNKEMSCQVSSVSPDALEVLSGYRWPGNVRELRNVIERAMILNPEAEELRPEHLPMRLREGRLAQLEALGDPISGSGDSVDLKSMEKRLIVDALDRTSGNQSQAARELGISRDALRYRMKKYGML